MPIARGPHTIMKFMSGWAWLMIASMAYLAFLVLLATILSIITGEANRVASGPLWEWAVAFTAPTLGYLMISAAVVGSDHAWRWIIGVVLGFWILITVFAVFQLPAFAIFLKSIWSGTYGLKTALFGGAVDPVCGLLLSNATSRWLVAMPLWIVGAAAATTILSYRHSE
jgi:hypothetical protein